jgi:hypothetical protein
MPRKGAFAGAGALLATALVGVTLLSGTPGAHAAGPVPIKKGDVFFGLGNGKIGHFAPSGTLLDTLNTTSGSFEETGMCFTPALSLHTTNFQAGTSSVFSAAGTLTKASFGSGYASPESCVVDAKGNFYYGNVNAATNTLLKISPSGALLKSYTPAFENRGTDWVDLGANQCTLYYTSEGSHIKRFNVCTNTQMTDFASLPASPCYAHRLRANGESIVACSTALFRVSAAGVVIKAYSGATLTFNGVPSTNLFATNLDPDGTTFWTADGGSGEIFRVNIASGAVLKKFPSAETSTFNGIAIAGELTVGQPTPTPAPTPTIAPTATGVPVPSTGLGGPGGGGGSPWPLAISLVGLISVALGLRATRRGGRSRVP